MTTARIQLFQLTFQSADNAPEAAPYATRALAMQAQVAAAAAALVSVGTGESLRDALEYFAIETSKPLTQVEALDDLTDDETIRLAEEVADFRSDISATWAEVDVYTLTDAIRNAGAVPVVFTTDDLTDRYAGDDPEGWLLSNRRRIEDILSERGNIAIDDLLAADGLLSNDEDEDEDED